MPAADAAPDNSAAAPGLTPELYSDLPRIFVPLAGFRRVLLAVSGGPDSTALMLLARQWRSGLPQGPELFVASVDHGLRAEARAEVENVAALAHRLGLPHAILTWPGALPAGGLQEAARDARYELLLDHAGAIGADAIATAHTSDDQAETVLFRLMRGSGLSGLAGIPAQRAIGDCQLVRPLLGVRKADLVEICRRAGVAFAQDPSNHNPRFARTRLRAMLPLLEAEGLDAPRFARLAARLARADAALEAATDAAAATVCLTIGGQMAPAQLRRAPLTALPEEISLRLLGRAIGSLAEGPVELAKLEALSGWIRALDKAARGARTLAGTLVRVERDVVLVRPAPARKTISVQIDANLRVPGVKLRPRHLGKGAGRT